MNKNTLNKAIKQYGSQVALANALGCSRQNICNIKRGAPASPRIVALIEKLIKENNND